jgi:2-hydroxychromene-2-carboxylate isomerase
VTAPVFYYDFSSPYSYLAAARIDDVIPDADWRPIVFGVLIREIGKVPWSMGPGREAGVEEVERRARERGLPAVRWPPGWPVESYSVLPLRAALAAGRRGRLKELSRAIYAAAFVEGRRLDEIEHVLYAGEAAGLDRDSLREAMEDEDVKAALRANTTEALERGVTGVPTVAIGESLFWGDDRLEEAAAAAG